MDDLNQQPLDELEQLLNEMEAHAPTRESVAGTPVVYRAITEDEPIDDSLPVEDLPDETTAEDAQSQPARESAEVHDFSPTLLGGEVAAVDCGIIRLGETENGLVIALRASVVIDDGMDTKIRLYRTGPMYLHNAIKAQSLYQMGKHLGKPDFFVDVDTSDPTRPVPLRAKSGVADDSHQYGDRFRNWFERLVQRVAVASVHNGIVLFDGALTLRTRDTPRTYLEQLANLASDNGNALIAVSKRSLLQVYGKPVRFWLNDAPYRACYRMLSGMMKAEGAEERVLGNAYAIRFSVLGPTLRMDVKPVKGQSDEEAIGQLYSSILVRGGYPDILVRAHTHSYFTSPDVLQLQAQASAKYSLSPEGEVDLTGIFGPFGGRFK